MSEAEPRVSVILPVYNRAELLPRAVASVLAQSCADLELIVVDDASTQDINLALNAFPDPRIRYFRREAQGGPAAARNTGIKHARGEYLAFQDSDDEWLLTKLEMQLQALQTADAATALVCCGMVRYSPDRIYCYSASQQAQADAQAAFQWIEAHLVAFTQTWLLRRSVFENAGGFDETLMIWEDWDLLLRIARASPVRFMPETLVVSYSTGDGISEQIPLRVSSLEQLLAKARKSGQSGAFIARLGYALGRFRVLAGDMPGARRSLRESLAYSPVSSRAWILLLASFIGLGFTQRLIEKATHKK